MYFHDIPNTRYYAFAMLAQISSIVSTDLAAPSTSESSERASTAEVSRTTAGLSCLCDSIFAFSSRAVSYSHVLDGCVIGKNACDRLCWRRMMGFETHVVHRSYESRHYELELRVRGHNSLGAPYLHNPDTCAARR